MTEITLLFRQIHPSFFHNGQPSALAFRPFPKDDYKLSVYDGDLIGPAEAYSHYTEVQRLESDGVLGVEVRECASLDLPATSSPESFEQHAHIDFTGNDKKQISSKSKSLLVFATARGWLYRKED